MGKKSTAPGALQEYAKEHEVNLETFIPQQIEACGSVRKAAIEIFNVTPMTLTTWLTRRGLSVETKQVAKVVKRGNRQTEIAP